MHLHREVVFYTEAVYVLGLFCIAAGAAFEHRQFRDVNA